MGAWQTVVGAAAGLAGVWAAMVVALYVMARREVDPSRLRDVLRLIPEVLRLLRRLAVAPEVPRRVRWCLAFLIGYLLLPIDLVPDFIPVAGFADDVVVVALGLRWVVRAAGMQALDRHWGGTDHGLAVVKRVARLEA